MTLGVVGSGSLESLLRRDSRDSGKLDVFEAKKETDFDTFVKLLIAQMNNQDPTNPMDSTEFVAQLASFSVVEQTIKTNGKLDQILSNASINGAEGYVGKYIQFEDSDGEIIEGYVESVAIYSDGMVATLDNGEKVLIGPGVTVMGSKPDSDPVEAEVEV
ncbi:flagellar hook assembly protein FlgD [Bartonella bovis]|uniref:Basal-body rod modification protein FlgD n=1 Tax=Bartonella bovis 91-4 TaxID=1094491 RepID=N6UIS9_9HYPH|nr:flagellar hook assembly protein FlgD [Bartonella bovis]ENN90148.1 flagellar hook capping protein [Bartonella bovis 91-4]